MKEVFGQKKKEVKLNIFSKKTVLKLNYIMCMYLTNYGKNILLKEIKDINKYNVKELEEKLKRYQNLKIKRYNFRWGELKMNIFKKKKRV